MIPLLAEKKTIDKFYVSINNIKLFKSLRSLCVVLFIHLYP